MAGDLMALKDSLHVVQELRGLEALAEQAQQPSDYLTPWDKLPVGVLQPHLSARLEPPLQPGPALKEAPLERYTTYFTKLLTEIWRICTHINSARYRLSDWIQGLGIRDLTLPARNLLEANVERLSASLAQSLAAFAIPSEFIETEIVQSFILAMASRSYHRLAEVYMSNRARHRRIIGAALRTDLPHIQQAACAVDRKLAEAHKLLTLRFRFSRYFEAWSIDQTIQWMTRYLEEGILIDLFVGEELITIFWYLDYLYEKLLALRTQIRIETKEIREAAQRLSMRGNRGKSRGASSAGGGAARGAKKSSAANCPSEAQVDTLEPTIHRLLAEGSRQLLLALSLLGRLFPPNPLNELSFNKRFAAFANIAQPPMLHYAFFHETTKPITVDNLPDLLACASQSFASARTQLQNAPNFPDRQNLLKVCVSNAVQIEMIKRRKPDHPLKPARVELLPECPYPLIYF